MTTPDPGTDAGLDAQVRKAAAVPFDDTRATKAVLARVHAARRPTPASGARWTLWAGPAAFASILLATPFVVARYPANEDALLVGLATGDPAALLMDTGQAFADEGVLE